MGAVGRHGVQAILGLDKQHLAALDALDFTFLLLSVLQVDTGKALQLELGRHDACIGREAGVLKVQTGSLPRDGLTEEGCCVTE